MMANNLSGLVNALPGDLLQDRETFDRIINRQVLEHLPANKLAAILAKHLPSSLSDEEKRKTTDDLFDNNLHFLNINQMDHFYKQAKIHKFTPELVKHLNELRSLRQKAYRLEEKKFQCKLLNEIIVKKRLLIKRVLLNNHSSLEPDPQEQSNPTNHLELTHKVDERYHKELEAIDLDNSLRLEDPLGQDKTNGTDHNEVRKQPPTNTYSVDDREYLKLLKNFKRKKLKNEVDDERLNDLSVKNVLDRVLEDSPEFEAKLVSLSEQPKSNKRKKQVVKKASIANKQRKISSQTDSLPSADQQPENVVQLNHQKVATPDNRPTLTVRPIKEPIDSRLIDTKLIDTKLTNTKLIDTRPNDASANGAKENEHINKLTTTPPANSNQEPPKPFSLSSVPPAICSTDWTVKESTASEKEEYRRQEVLRYRNPNAAFTFNLHNYKSVVGPVKNCTFIKESSNTSKLKNRTTILKERPPHVTYLSLVRDSAARLPNGQGTRSDIVCLMKDSQYLREDLTDEQISGIVSGALDRLHYEKDPAVRYDSTSKLWVYCHRHRTEEEFNSLHRLQIEANKVAKGTQKVPKRPPTSAKKTCDKPAISPKTVNGVERTNVAVRTNGDDRREPALSNHQQPVDRVEKPLRSPAITVTAPPNSQLRTVQLSQAKLINLSHEDSKVNDYNINIKKHQANSSKPIEIAAKKDSSTGKEKTGQTAKKVGAVQSKQVQIKPRINKPDDSAGYTTTFSNLRLINESIKQVKQKPPATKKLKIEQPDESNKGSQMVISPAVVSPAVVSPAVANPAVVSPAVVSNEIRPVVVSNEIQPTVISNEMRPNPTILKLPCNQPMTQQPRPTNTYTAVPILSAKPTKDEGKPIMVSSGASGINLSGANVILNSGSCPLILSSTGTSLNGYTYTMTKNGNQIYICPQNASILKGKSLAGQKIQTMHLVPFNSVQQTAQGLTSKAQPIVAKIIPKPAQISLSTAGAGQPTKSIICSPKLISSKAPNL